MRAKSFISLTLVATFAGLLSGCSDTTEKKAINQVIGLNGFRCDFNPEPSKKMYISFPGDHPYEKAREEIIKQGWLPIPFSALINKSIKGCDGTTVYANKKTIYPEELSCSLTGMNPCHFMFIKNGELLSVLTQYQPHQHMINLYYDAKNVRAGMEKAQAEAAKFAEKQRIKEQERIEEANRTPLERAIDPFTGSRAKYKAWKDEGGLDHPEYRMREQYQTFYGITVSSLTVGWAADKAISVPTYIEAIVYRGSPKQKREALARACRIPSSAFKELRSGDEKATSDDLTCTMSEDRILILRKGH